MKEFLAVAAIALGLLVIYRVLEPRLRPTEPAARVGTPGEFRGSLRISEGLAPHVQAVAGPLVKRNAADLVTPLVTLRQRFAERQRIAEPAMQPVFAAADRAIAAMLVAAEEKTKLARELVQIASKPSALETRRSTNSSTDFFIERVTSRWEQQRQVHEVAVNRELNHLRDEERRYQEKSRQMPTVELQVFIVPVEGIRAKPPATALDRRAY